MDEDPQVFIDEVFKVVDSMGVTFKEKLELDSYKLKEVEQVWFVQWRDERPIRADPVNLGLFKMTFLDRLFPLELRDINVVEFMNLLQGGMSVNEYSLKFTQLSMYAPTFIANSRAIMNKFVMGVSSLVEEECRTTILHYDINFSRLMVYAQPTDASKIRNMNGDGKIVRSDEPNQRDCRKRFYNQDSSTVSKDRYSKQNSQGGNGVGSTFERTRCTTCEKQHLGKCLTDMGGCFGYEIMV